MEISTELHTASRRNASSPSRAVPYSRLSIASRAASYVSRGEPPPMPPAAATGRGETASTRRGPGANGGPSPATPPPASTPSPAFRSVLLICAMLVAVAALVAVVRCRRHVEGRAADEESGGLELKAGIADRHHRPLLGARDVVGADAVPEDDIGALERAVGLHVRR